MAGEPVGTSGRASERGLMRKWLPHQLLWSQFFSTSPDFSMSFLKARPYTLFNTPATPLPLVRATLAGFSFLGAS